MWKDVPSKLSELVLGDASGMGCRVIVQEHGALTVRALLLQSNLKAVKLGTVDLCCDGLALWQEFKMNYSLKSGLKNDPLSSPSVSQKRVSNTFFGCKPGFAVGGEAPSLGTHWWRRIMFTYRTHFSSPVTIESSSKRPSSWRFRNSVAIRNRTC